MGIAETDQIHVRRASGMRPMIGRACLAITATMLFPSAANADVIDFEEFRPPDAGVLAPGPAFTSNGYTFTSVSGRSLIADNEQVNIPNTGSNTLVQNAGRPAAEFVMTEATGGAFDLLSVLALEGRNRATGFFAFSSTGIDVTGTFANGGSIFTTITLDLFARENDLLDAQLITFSGWTGLSSVSFTGVGGLEDGYSFAIDDIVVSPTAVSEPSTLALLGIGLAGIGFGRGQRTQ